MTYLTIAFIGIFGGIVSGFFGVGGGLIFVPLLILLRGLDPHMAVGTSLAVVVPTAFMGALTHQHAGKIDWRAALFLVIFAVAGAFLGARLSLAADAVLLRRLLAVFLLALSLKMFFPN